ncbi:uncharacterized protein BJ212DRAFT_1489820 [Suillus subaureus]|uniref:DUF6830 domain-containing protein n=1 Tax=Suillus subaureus TaxID=48587 RepID=A0A9P7DJA6_9AGAM|nr:uncharacterized protein BJ212DRAFT_1489820 [Suillus subaureus]KAG1795240.1 hypothetical protein BJ212DRAFT_1489820 [Suillus subaureus]
MIAAVAKNASPLTMATQEHFGDGILHPPRTRKHTLELLIDIAKMVDPWDLDKFQKAAKALNLSGVHMPYWHDWICACLSIFLAGEILHTCFKFSANHPLKWVKETNPVHSLQSLQAMMQALSDFHSFKDTIVAAEVRKGKNGVKEDFFIPKLELMQSFEGTIRRLGTLMQFSADTTERLLIMHCKDLFPRWLDNESMEIFGLYALLTSQGASLVNAIHTEDEDVTITNPALSWVSHILPDEVKSVHGPRPVRNHFLKGILSGDALTAFQLNVTPDYKSLSLAEIHTKYTLPDFDRVLTDFIHHSSLANSKHTHWDPKYGRFQVWNKFQLQLHSAFQPRVIMPGRVVQAYPPSNDFPLGNCNTILIDGPGMDDSIMSHVTQVRLIFQPTIQQGSDVELPACLSNLLLYVQYFCFISCPEDHPELMMWTVEHVYTHDANGNCHRQGAIMQVMDATHAVELIPEYGEAVDKSMTSATCLESYKCFFLNNFADKESYHVFSTKFV